MATRFLGLASVGNAKKEKFLHALQVTPAAQMDAVQLVALPGMTHACTFGSVRTCRACGGDTCPFTNPCPFANPYLPPTNPPHTMQRPAYMYMHPTIAVCARRSCLTCGPQTDAPRAHMRWRLRSASGTLRLQWMRRGFRKVGGGRTAKPSDIDRCVCSLCVHVCILSVCAHMYVCVCVETWCWSTKCHNLHSYLLTTCKTH